MADYRLRTYRMYLDGKPTELKVMLSVRDVETINKALAESPDAFHREYRLEPGE